MSIKYELNLINEYINDLELENQQLKNTLYDITNYIEKHNVSFDSVGEDILKLAHNYDRVCAICSKPMTSGYCVDDGFEYYCSDECLHEHYTDEEYNRLYDDGNGDSYWTEW